MENKNPSISDNPSFWLPLKYMFFSVLAFTIMNSIAKYLDNISAYQIVFFRGTGSLFLCVAYLKMKNIHIWGTHKKLLWSRAVVGTLSMFTFFVAIKMMPFGSAVSLRYLAPIFAAIFAIIFLKEKISPLQWLCFIAAFIGVLILKGFDPRINLWGLIIVLTSAVFTGFVYVLISKIGQREHPVVIVFYFMLFAVIFGGFFSIFFWEQPNGSDWWFLIGLGIFGFVGQLYLTQAYQLGEASTVVPLKYIEAVFALIVGWVWFGEAYEVLSLVGISIIIGSMMLNIIIKQKSKK